MRSSARNSTANGPSSLFNGVSPPVSPKIVQEEAARSSSPSSSSDVAVVYDASFSVGKKRDAPVRLNLAPQADFKKLRKMTDAPFDQADQHSALNNTSKPGSTTNCQNSDRKESVEEQDEEMADLEDVDSPLPNSGNTDDGQMDELDMNGGALGINGKPARFNDDLLCKHGNLTFKVRRVWLRRDEWEALKAIYTSLADGGDESFCCDAIPCTQPECDRCIEEYHESEALKITCQSMLDDIHSSVGKLLRAIEKRKSWREGELGLVYSRVLCPNFVNKFLKAAK